MQACRNAENIQALIKYCLCRHTQRHSKQLSTQPTNKPYLYAKLQSWYLTSCSSCPLLLFTVSTLLLCTTNHTRREAFVPRERVHSEKSGSPHTPPVLHVLRTIDRKSNSWGSACMQSLPIVLPTCVVSQIMLAAALVVHVALSVGGEVEGRIGGVGDAGEGRKWYM